ncbi:Mucin-associated surface protein (MASP) [Trypanosoma cruzi]|uniref:Mucin-associated surface protein (MASP) n=2 Tax=Trypanosoma cruzi TaxID=5693 RepID=A0A2V2XAA2_TRYCR|nr:Mucin-associated surface protein (MASP) [Trypanosoma cruzi]
MMMTMTGRVLLVCALCVLWCGAGGGEPSETPSPAPPDTPHEKNPQKEEEAFVGTGQGVKNDEPEIPQAPAPKASESPVVSAESLQAQQSGGGASVTASATTDNKDQNAKEDKKEEEAKDDDEDEEEEEEEEEQEDRDSIPDGREEETEVIISEQETEQDKKNAGNQAPTETPGGPTNNEEIKTATTQVNGQPSPEDLGDVKQSEEVQGEKDSNHNPQTKSVASIAAKQQNEPSADHEESRPPSPTANGDAANKDFDKSTKDGIPSNHPAADVAGTAEGKQNENKDANPKETPVTATAMKTARETTGESDGSTAVSHTTSPLLLLLVVAAAAAVVAA